MLIAAEAGETVAWCQVTERHTAHLVRQAKTGTRFATLDFAWTFLAGMPL